MLAAYLAGWAGKLPELLVSQFLGYAAYKDV